MSKSNRKNTRAHSSYVAPSSPSSSSSSERQSLAEEFSLKDYGAFLSESDIEEDCSTRPVKASLSLVAEKELLVNIQRLGGIDKFSLRQLLQDKPELYRIEGNKVQTEATKRLIQNKVNIWKTKGRSKFNTLVLAYGQELSETHRTAKQTPTPSKKRVTELPWPSPSQSFASPAQRPPPESPFRQLGTSTMLPSFVKQILETGGYINLGKVDLLKPERKNGNFLICYFTDQPVGKTEKTLHNGFVIVITEADMRFFQENAEHYVA